MQCFIYKSGKKPDTYLYMRRQDDFSEVPDSLLAVFGGPVFVMELELTPQRKLASEDVSQVLRNLDEKGFHLQLPPVDYERV